MRTFEGKSSPTPNTTRHDTSRCNTSQPLSSLVSVVVIIVPVGILDSARNMESNGVISKEVVTRVFGGLIRFINVSNYTLQFPKLF